MPSSREAPKARSLALAASLAALALMPACSIKKLAINSLGNALAEGTSSFGRDDDPELVWDAVPFGLKTVESLLLESPRHRGLLLAAARGFTQYAYGDLEQEADFTEDQDLARATKLRGRARRLYKRALDYGLRGLEVDVRGFRQALRPDPGPVLARTRKKQVGLLYWTAAAWGAAISISLDDSELAADQYLAEAMMRRALALDETWELGSIHDFFISYEGARLSVGGSLEKARSHLARAVELSRGGRAWPYVTFAETVSVARQDKAEFASLLARALAVDPDAALDQRLSNVIAQRRARWLLDRTEVLFLE
jgi:predicted anti-sigma-YlaC factor YlaD